jgi:hypothetical protein
MTGWSARLKPRGEISQTAPRPLPGPATTVPNAKNDLIVQTVQSVQIVLSAQSARIVLNAMIGLIAGIALIVEIGRSVEIAQIVRSGRKRNESARIG